MIEIIFDEENKRAVACDEGVEIGTSTFSLSSQFWIIDHTEVDEAYKGQQIGQRLVAAIVKEARAAKVKIIPLCPFAKREFETKEEYADMLYGK